MRSAIGFILILFMIWVSCQSNSERKIRLSSGDTSSGVSTQTASSVLQVVSEDQRSIAILLFKNESGDPALNWLERGLMEMLITDMKQSPFLNVIPASRFLEIAQQQGKSSITALSQLEIDQVAQQAKIQIVLRGRYYYKSEHLFIDVDMRDVYSGQNMFVRSVEGESLEKIFTMVDELSGRVRENLRGNPDNQGVSEIDLAEMTNSVEAFRCFSEAQENRDKLFIAEAERCYRDAIKYDSTFAAAYLELAMLKMDRGRGSEHERLLEKADKYKYKLSAPDQLRLQILQKFNHRDIYGSVVLLEDAVRKFPLDLDFRAQLAGFYLEYLGDMNQALKEYEYILELDPNRKLVYNHLGYLYAARGDFTTALKYFDQYQVIAPDEPNPYDSKSEILIRAGRFEEAESLLLTALEKWPNFYYLPYRLSEIYFELGNEEKTIKYLNMLNDFRLDKKYDFNVDVSLAEIYWRFGHIEQAIKAYRRAMNNNPTSITVPISLAQLYESIGDSAATNMYQEAISRIGRQIPTVTGQPNRFGDFVGLMLGNNLSVSQSIKVLENLQIDSDSQSAVLRDITLCILYIRAKEIEKAKLFYKTNRNTFSDFILESTYGGWQFWRYVYEIMDVMANEPEFADSYQNLLERARKSPRRNIEPMIKLGITRFEVLSKGKFQSQDMYSNLGIPADTVWRVIGPFGMGNHSVFDYAYPPESKIDMNVTYSSSGNNISWQLFDDGYEDGYFDFRKLYPHTAWSVGYALVYIYSPDERKVQFRLGSDEACKLWLNNKKIWQHYIKEGARYDRDLITVLLHPGYNKLLLKITNNLMDWGFYFRVTDENGQGFPDITFHSYDEVERSLAVR